MKSRESQKSGDSKGGEVVEEDLPSSQDGMGWVEALTVILPVVVEETR